ncbi:uncharacterized protein LOC128279373 [Gossypium arboreum]|uniref:uncharacterized protein LOC128279373 n=1 Tax=Gossypium arboreum TaxID=29729 RepID=UPI0022F1C93E|nr:uncharacterized protein LOC128279373 [Gossypium arboreum]
MILDQPDHGVITATVLVIQKKSASNSMAIVKKKKEGNKTALLSSTAADDGLDVRLTKTQFETLHKILGTSTAHGSLATQGIGLNIAFESNNQSSWILDSGASDHMTGTEIGEDDWHY